MATNTSRTARYRTLRVTSERGTPRHYHHTRHGWVARTWIGTTSTEVVLHRRSHTATGGTYQGSVHAVPGGWQAVDTTGNTPTPVGPVCVDYLDAEALLLPRRTGYRAQGVYRWPAH